MDKNKVCQNPIPNAKRNSKQDGSIISGSDRKTNFSGISNLMLTRDFNIKIVTLISSLSVLGAIVVAIVFSFFKTHQRILTFDYNKSHHSIEDIFCINLVMFYIFLSGLSIINIFLIFALIREYDSILTKLVFSELRWYFLFSQFFLAGPFILGILIEKNNVSLISSVSCNILVGFLICFYYRQIKAKKNLSLGSFINIFVYTSIILCFVTYTMFYNISEILVMSFYKSGKNFDLKSIQTTVTITSHSIFAVITIVLITYFKDVVYCSTLIYFIAGYLASDKIMSGKELVSTIIILSFISVAVLVTLLKYRKAAFGYEEEVNIDEILIARREHKKSSWFGNGMN